DPIEALCAGGGGKTPAERIICNCNKVSDRVLIEAIENGADSVSALGEVTKAGTGCGSCKADLGQLLAVRIKKLAPPLEAAS
ncbi:MAG TPA: (2Fe-2S)-binding protein, partial [Polyangiales bacterium]